MICFIDTYLSSFVVFDPPELLRKVSFFWKLHFSCFFAGKETIIFMNSGNWRGHKHKEVGRLSPRGGESLESKRLLMNFFSLDLSSYLLKMALKYIKLLFILFRAAEPDLLIDSNEWIDWLKKKLWLVDLWLPDQKVTESQLNLVTLCHDFHLLLPIIDQHPSIFPLRQKT